MKSDASDAGARQMTKEEENQQVEYFNKWLKENGLNPNLWDLIDSMAASLKEHKLNFEYNPV